MYCVGEKSAGNLLFPSVRVEKLLAEGKPIPPTAAQQEPGETLAVRRWSTKALTTKRIEPCSATGECPVTMQPGQKPLAAVA